VRSGSGGGVGQLQLTAPGKSYVIPSVEAFMLY
jgi:hypothetical protein